MIKELRLKFIGSAMFSIVTMMILLMVTINLTSYIRINKRLEGRLGYIVENKDFFNTNDNNEQYLEQDMAEEVIQELNTNEELSKETPYDIRYFAVYIVDDEIVKVDTKKIASLSYDDAEMLALKQYNRHKLKGIAGKYKYIACEKICSSGKHKLVYIFLDAERELETIRSVMKSSVLLGIIGIIVAFVLVLYSSKIVLKPVAESYDKQVEFITNASHEIKTPLAIIKASTDVVELDYGESEWTNSINNQVNRLSQLTDEMVFLAEMSEEHAKVSMNEFALSRVISESIEAFKPIAALKSIEATAYIEPDMFFYGNEENIRRLITILADNAAKYTNESGKVEFSAHKEGKNIHIRLFNETDNIKKGNLNILFDRFYRTDESRNSDTGGHGIGLSIAKMIVSIHKGKISAVSNDGKSIEFNVYLPIIGAGK